MSIHQQQSQRLGLEAYQRLSPLLEKCCLRLSANESDQHAQAEVEALTGVKIGHSSLHRLVQRQDFTLPDAKQSVNEVSLDGGKVRLRGEKGQACKSAGLQGNSVERDLLWWLLPRQLSPE